MMDDDVFSLDNDSDGYVPEPKVRSLAPRQPAVGFEEVADLIANSRRTESKARCPQAKEADEGACQETKSDQR